MTIARLCAACGLVLLVALAPEASAQRGLSGRQYDALPFPQPNLYPVGAGLGSGHGAEGSSRPTILLTGYWPPTNEMLRHFSPDPIQNPAGWQGSNWEDRGYDVYAYFPEFPAGLGQGVGDLEVDYQDTTADFWPIANNLKPIAVITFSRGFTNSKWELEWNNRNLQSWVDDYTAPLQPTPAPPDPSVPAGTVRNSTLPIQDVLDAVRAAGLPNFSAHVDMSGNGGGFLSEFIAYLGVWYQSRHTSPADPAWCVAGGHVHVGSMIHVPKARRATHQTLRAVMRYVDEVTGVHGGHTSWFCPTTANSTGTGAILTAIGTHSITKNDLRLTVVEAVPGGFGLAFYGPTTQPAAPFGDGMRCVAGPLFRILPAIQAGANGLGTVALDFNQAPLSAGAGGTQPGSTWHFQFWLRDVAAGGAGFTASSGLSLTFAP